MGVHPVPIRDLVIDTCRLTSVSAVSLCFEFLIGVKKHSMFKDLQSFKQKDSQYEHVENFSIGA